MKGLGNKSNIKMKLAHLVQESGVSGQRNNSRRRNSRSAQFSILRHKVSIVVTKKVPKIVWRVLFEPVLYQAFYGLIVLLLRSVGKSATRKPAKIAIETRTDMVKFMNNRIQFLRQRQFNEARNIEIENIQILDSIGSEVSLERPDFSSALIERFAVFKAERRCRRKDAVGFAIFRP